MNDKKVSVIMGIYNCADTLCESIDTIINQTYKNWEFVICDDGSVDNSFDIANAYKEKYPNKFIVIKNEKNLGLNATLNKCLLFANGEYIARQDGDDVSERTRFEKEVQFLEQNKEYAFVSSNMAFFDEKGVWGEWKNPERPEKADFLRQSPCFAHAACMVRREAFLQVEGYTVEEKFLRCEDVNLWYKLYAAGYKGYNIQEALYSMRDDRNAYQRRTFKNRMNVICAEWDGMHRLQCSFFEYRFFLKKLMRNLILALMPEKIYMILHKKRLNR